MNSWKKVKSLTSWKRLLGVYEFHLEYFSLRSLMSLIQQINDNGHG